jgi:hypothetical protein
MYKMRSKLTKIERAVARALMESLRNSCMPDDRGGFHPLPVVAIQRHEHACRIAARGLSEHRKAEGMAKFPQDEFEASSGYYAAAFVGGDNREAAP